MHPFFLSLRSDDSSSRRLSGPKVPRALSGHQTVQALSQTSPPSISARQNPNVFPQTGEKNCRTTSTPHRMRRSQSCNAASMRYRVSGGCEADTHHPSLHHHRGNKRRAANIGAFSPTLSTLLMELGHRVGAHEPSHGRPPPQPNPAPPHDTKDPRLTAAFWHLAGPKTGSAETSAIGYHRLLSFIVSHQQEIWSDPAAAVVMMMKGEAPPPPSIPSSHSTTDSSFHAVKHLTEFASLAMQWLMDSSNVDGDMETWEGSSSARNIHRHHNSEAEKATELIAIVSSTSLGSFSSATRKPPYITVGAFCRGHEALPFRIATAAAAQGAGDSENTNKRSAVELQGDCGYRRSATRQQQLVFLLRMQALYDTVLRYVDAASQDGRGAASRVVESILHHRLAPLRWYRKHCGESKLPDSYLHDTDDAAAAVVEAVRVGFTASQGDSRDSGVLILFSLLMQCFAYLWRRSATRWMAFAWANAPQHLLSSSEGGSISCKLSLAALRPLRDEVAQQLLRRCTGGEEEAANESTKADVFIQRHGHHNPSQVPLEPLLDLFPWSPFFTPSDVHHPDHLSAGRTPRHQWRWGFLGVFAVALRLALPAAPKPDRWTSVHQRMQHSPPMAWRSAAVHVAAMAVFSLALPLARVAGAAGPVLRMGLHHAKTDGDAMRCLSHISPGKWTAGGRVKPSKSGDSIEMAMHAASLPMIQSLRWAATVAKISRHCISGWSLCWAVVEGVLMYGTLQSCRSIFFFSSAEDQFLVVVSLLLPLLLWWVLLVWHFVAGWQAVGRPVQWWIGHQAAFAEAVAQEIMAVLPKASGLSSAGRQHPRELSQPFFEEMIKVICAVQWCRRSAAATWNYTAVQGCNCLAAVDADNFEMIPMVCWWQAIYSNAVIQYRPEMQMSKVAKKVAELYYSELQQAAEQELTTTTALSTSSVPHTMETAAMSTPRQRSLPLRFLSFNGDYLPKKEQKLAVCIAVVAASFSMAPAWVNAAPPGHLGPSSGTWTRLMNLLTELVYEVSETPAVAPASSREHVRKYEMAKARVVEAVQLLYRRLAWQSTASVLPSLLHVLFPS